MLLPNASARSKAPRRCANHITQDTTNYTTDPAELFTAAEYAQISQLGRDLSNPSAALADLAAMSQVMQEIFSSVEQDEQGGNTAWALNDFEFIDSTLGPFCNTSETGTQKLHLLRVGSDGSSTDMIVKQWSWQDTRTCPQSNACSARRSRYAGKPSSKAAFRRLNGHLCRLPLDDGAQSSRHCGGSVATRAGESLAVRNIEGTNSKSLASSAARRI